MRVTAGERSALERTARAVGLMPAAVIKEALGLSSCGEPAADAPKLRRVVIERDEAGRFRVVRERDAGGETFIARNLVEAFAFVLAAYLPCGTQRAWGGRKVAA